MTWPNSKNDIFSVKSLYASLSCGRMETFPYSIVWNFWVPSRVSFFEWEATWNGILRLDQLKRRG